MNASLKYIHIKKRTVTEGQKGHEIDKKIICRRIYSSTIINIEFVTKIDE
jgi:hypothetical protein